MYALRVVVTLLTEAKHDIGSLIGYSRTKYTSKYEIRLIGESNRMEAGTTMHPNIYAIRLIGEINRMEAAHTRISSR